MRSLQISIWLAMWLWAWPLSAETPAVVIYGGQQPQFGLGSVTLQPPDYALQIECTGGGAKFKLTGEPNLNPSPKLRPDGWWDCSGRFRVQFAYSSQSAELVLASVAAAQGSQDGTVVEKRLRLDFVPAALASSLQSSAINPQTDWRAMIIPGMALMVAGFALVVILHMNQTNWQRNQASRERAKDWDDQISALQRRVMELEIQSRSSASPINPAPEKMNAQTDTEAGQAMAAVVSFSGRAASSSAPESDSTLNQDAEDALLRDVKQWCKRLQNRSFEVPNELRAKLRSYQELVNKTALVIGGASDGGSIQELAQRGFAIAVFVADYTDQHLDQPRSDPEWQALLRRILEAAKTEAINPVRNDEFDENTHTQVGAVEKQSPDDLLHHVAWLRHRGFRFAGDVLRKASVVLYE